MESSAQPTLRILRLPEVKRQTGLSRTALYARIARGRFPKQVNLDGRAVGWLEAQVTEWIRQRLAGGEGG